MNKSEIANKIMNARPRTMTQEEASKRLGISKATLSAYENGKTQIPFAIVLKMCCIDGKNLEDLK